VPPLLTHVYSEGTNSTPGALLTDMNKDCEVIIKLGGPKSINTYLGKQPLEIRKKVKATGSKSRL
jgi:hypothetical protein